MSRHPWVITTRGQFEATEFEVGVIYDDSDTPSRICRYEYREDGWYRCTMAEYPDGDRELAQDPSHFPLRLVSEPAPTPGEPTDEQREAVEWLRAITIDAYTRQEVTFAQELLAALPDTLTNPQPVLPTEPGLYVGPGGTRGPVWRLDVESLRYDGSAPPLYREGGRDTATPADGPFTRLVLERPQVTMEDLTRVYAEHTGALGVPLTLARDLLKLANGTPDE